MPKMVVPAGTPRILKPTGAEVERVMQTPFPLQKGQLVQLDYPVTSAGVTAHVIIDAALQLGDTGVGLGKDMLKYVEHSYTTLTQWFGLETPVKLHIVLSPLSENYDGSGGAYHHSCDDPVLYIDATFTTADPTDHAMGLWVAELTEVFAATAIGSTSWDCGNSMGEGLSRVVAQVLHPKAMGQFVTSPAWLGGDRGNFVDQVTHTDQDDQANGCTVLFLFWLRSLGYSYEQIVKARGKTLAEVYCHLTGKVTAWEDFFAAVSAKWPVGSKMPTIDNAWIQF